MDTAINFKDPGPFSLDLNNIRFQLVRIEDTITFHLIERAQFPLNPTIYQAGGVAIPNSDLSLFDWALREQERLQSLIRRYQSPDEYAFFPDVLQEPILAPVKYPPVLHTNDVNINPKLKDSYIKNILPSACDKKGPNGTDDSKENYGSAVTCDITCIQALSRRVHYGKFVAESKFQKETDRYVALIKAADRKGIDEAITDAKVEKKLLERLRLKAQTYGRDPGFENDAPVKIDAEAVVSLYRDHVIPLTKEVEVEYLMQRLKGTQWE